MEMVDCGVLDVRVYVGGGEDVEVGDPHTRGYAAVCERTGERSDSGRCGAFLYLLYFPFALSSNAMVGYVGPRDGDSPGNGCRASHGGTLQDHHPLFLFFCSHLLL